MKMWKSSLRERWVDKPSRTRAEDVVDALSTGKPLQTLDVPRFEGRLDLRGVSLPRSVTAERSFEWSATELPRQYEVTPVDGRTEIAAATLMDVDLSLGDLSETSWKKCVVRNVLLDEANLSDAIFDICVFEDVGFRRANLHGASFASPEANVFRRVSFVKADMRDTVHGYSLFEDCDFSYAKLDGVDFEGSRFVRCKFAGKLSEVTVRGWYSTATEKQREFLATQGVAIESLLNPMLDVDFSEAYLDWCMFLDGIDLSRSRFPADGDHILIPDRDTVYKQMGRAIAAGWTEPDRTKALRLLSQISGWANQKGQRMDLINRRSYESEPSSRRDLRWMKAFFDLMHETANRLPVGR